MFIRNKMTKVPGAAFRSMAPIKGLLAMILVLGLLVGWPAAIYADTAPAVVLEELHYQVNILMWRDAFRAKVTLKRLDNGHYRAEIDSESQGTLKQPQGQFSVYEDHPEQKKDEQKAPDKKPQ